MNKTRAPVSVQEGLELFICIPLGLRGCIPLGNARQKAQKGFIQHQLSVGNVSLWHEGSLLYVFYYIFSTALCWFSHRLNIMTGNLILKVTESSSKTQAPGPNSCQMTEYTQTLNRLPQNPSKFLYLAELGTQIIPFFSFSAPRLDRFHHRSVEDNGITPFKTGNHGELFYVLLILKVSVALGYVSLFTRRVNSRGRRQYVIKEKTNGLWNQVDMGGKHSSASYCNDLSQCWGLSFLTSKMMINPYPSYRNFAGTELRKYVTIYFKDKSLCVRGEGGRALSYLGLIDVCVCLNVYILCIYFWLCWV